ncbi:hypothetical protein VTK56DRAFT_9180 [Thermocarpiscus australiensis]
MVHASRLPQGTTRAQALAMLSDYEFFLSCDPHLDKFERIVPDAVAGAGAGADVPDAVRDQQLRDGPSGSAAPVCYRVTDIVHAIPAGIWDTNVVSTYEFTDIRDGMFVRIRSPLSIVMDTFWEVRPVGDGEGEGEAGELGLELVEDMTIQCSRFLVGLVKGQCENGWGKIHEKMIGRLEREVKGSSQG